MSDDGLDKKNSRLAVKLVLFAAMMFGFGYALVPLYNVLCDLVGQNAKVETVAKQETAFQPEQNREVTVEFLTSLNRSVPMAFKAETSSLKVHPGQYYSVGFYAKNLSNRRLKVRAVATYAPGQVKEYVTKVICFCELEQIFEPNEEKNMTVRLVVDPKLPERYKTITLSYTFFEITENSEN